MSIDVIGVAHPLRVACMVNKLCTSLIRRSFSFTLRDLQER